MEDKNLWHKAACGHLVQGLVHNMSGPLQILSMQVELLRMTQAKLRQALPPEEQALVDKQEERLAQIEAQLERLKGLLEAIGEITQDSPGPVDLNQVVEKMLLFWEGDLKFKHQIPKEIDLSATPLKIVAPLGEITQGFCALFWALVSLAVKENKPFLVKTAEGPRVTLGVKGASLPQDDPLLQAAKELLSPFAEIEQKDQTITLKFKTP